MTPLRLVVALSLCSLSPFTQATVDCDRVAASAAGIADYVYTSARVSASPRLHFYSAPSASCQLPAFLVKGDSVEVLRSSPQRTESGDIIYKDSGTYRLFVEYRYVRFRDDKGNFATGWVEASGLTDLKNRLSISKQCQKWQDGASFEMQHRHQNRAPLPDNLYEVQGEGRAWFYSLPTEQCRSDSVFLLPGDKVSLQETSTDDFIEAVYYTADRQIVRGWLKQSQLKALNNGDRYRDDINPLSTDKAVRAVTLNLRHDNTCVLYESWNEEKAISIIVREDHQSADCRGGGDPDTAPAINEININKSTGEITSFDTLDGPHDEGDP
ncbi:MAG: hypothetical protein E7B59_15180 [Enterobacteriaceae bacterium]|nr:hypothetical protein [Enterobacteriaceae bacterium]